MRRLIYTLLSVSAIAIVVILAVVIRNNNSTLPSANIPGEIVPIEKKELEKITVSEVTHSVFYAPQYVAMNLGFFEEEGLELELINGGGANNVMTAVLSDQVDIRIRWSRSCNICI